MSGNIYLLDNGAGLVPMVETGYEAEALLQRLHADHPDLLAGDQALEEALDRLWDARLPDMRRASRATQLACLSVASSDLELASEVRAAWHALSRACHHQQYELAPTAPELEAWFGQVERLVGALERRPG
jgi:hypothetical protein